MTLTRFRNVENNGDWKQGDIRTFEYLEYLSPPANGENYVADEAVARTTLLSNTGLFGEDTTPVGANIDFTSNYDDSLTNIMDGEDYRWLGDSSGYIEVLAVEFVEEDENGNGDWYKVTVKVSESIPVGNYQIISAHLEGTVSGMSYEIVGGAEGYILYLDGDVRADFGALGELDIIDSSENNGSYSYGQVNYDAPHTLIWLDSYLPSATYDGKVTNVVPGEAPG